MRNVSLSRPRLSARGIVRYLLDMDAHYRTRVQLRELDDKMLRDIGLTRADVAEELRRTLR
jgi:uncharacterized protein YjiS (DUF1127 family)